MVGEKGGRGQSKIAEARRPCGRGIEVARKTLSWYRQGGKTLRIPVPVEDLASFLGYRVVLLTTVPDEFCALISTQQMLIGINRNHHLHRRRFSVGHEIGHLLLNHPPEIACNSAEIILYDREADECASELLMPEELLAPMARKVSGIEQLSRMFQVSVQAMERRLNRLEEESL